jgi:site-specific DNA recombinase
VPIPVLQRARTVIADCDAKLERYRAALEAGADPAVVTGWIAAATAERANAEADLARHATDQPSTPGRLSRDEIAALAATIGDALAVLRTADPADKAEVYRQLGLRLTYHPDTQTVAAQAHLARLPWGNGSCPRPDRYHNPTHRRGR